MLDRSKFAIHNTFEQVLVRLFIENSENLADLAFLNFPFGRFDREEIKNSNFNNQFSFLIQSLHSLCKIHQSLFILSFFIFLVVEVVQSLTKDV